MWSNQTNITFKAAVIEVGFRASIQQADGRRTARSQSREIQVYTITIALKFDSSTANMFDKFQSNMIIITSNLRALRLHETCR